MRDGDCPRIHNRLSKWKSRVRTLFDEAPQSLLSPERPAPDAYVLPKPPVSGRVKTAELCAAESGVYSARFRGVFGRWLECTTMRLEGSTGCADADAELLRDGLP